MPIDILVTTNRIASDPEGREFVDYMQKHCAALGLDDSVLYYDFPLFSDYETVVYKPDVLLVSPRHGILPVRFLSAIDPTRKDNVYLDSVDESLGQFSSILIGRLLKSRSLRRNLSALRFAVTPVVLSSGGKSPTTSPPLQNSESVSSLSGFELLLKRLSQPPFDATTMAETRSVVEGAKALTRPQKRTLDDPKTPSPVAALSKLEAEIANFDQHQRRVALVAVPGPQRIRGLAGSGKTVILAMKAAHLHLARPDDRILVTFHTRSLRASLKNLITRFYRHYKEEDPDWNRVVIRHGWGGSSSSGVYADACRRNGQVPLTFGAARQAAKGADPLDWACRELIKNVDIKQHYDHILIDEGQDFPSGFYELCFQLARGKRDKKNIVWAYDELQNILNVNIRSTEELFGIDKDGLPRISLERSGRNLPPGATNDTVLSKCYRNQREVLVTAHAIGFGIYRDIVQLLESREHWQDVGYEVLSSGEFSVGKTVRILRPPENSPISLDQTNLPKIIECYVASSFVDEINWIVAGVSMFLQGGLHPEDIMIVALDDRNARTYFRVISSTLAEHDIPTNNITADPYNEPPFTIAGMVTLSTVYRAKGNEASVVFALGVDAVSMRTRSDRNKLFTAFTRTKAWLRVSGVSGSAQKVCEEISAALKKFPYIEFIMPDLRQVELIQRDLSVRAVKAKRIRDEYTRRLRDEGFSDLEISDILAVEVKDV